MFEIFTQKLANKDESVACMGLFIDLCSKTVHSPTASEVFEIVLSHAVHRKRPSISISMNNPKTCTPVTKKWNPLHLPTLDTSMCQHNAEESTSLVEIKQALRRFNSSVQLHILHCHLLMQKYSYTNNIKDAHSALLSCMIASELDPFSVPSRYIRALLEIFPREDLQKLESNSTGIFVKLIHEIIEVRNAEISEISEESEETSEDSEDSKSSTKTSTASVDDVVEVAYILDSLRNTLKSTKNTLFTNCRSSICVRFVTNRLLESKLIPDDFITITK